MFYNFYNFYISGCKARATIIRRRPNKYCVRVLIINLPSPVMLVVN